MKVEERGAPGFSKEYINRRAKNLQLHFSHSLAILHRLLAHSRTHTLGSLWNYRGVGWPPFHSCVPGWVQTLKWALAISPAALAARCPAFVMCESDLRGEYLHRLWGRPYHTFKKYSLSLCKHALKKKFCTCAITASQLLQLITCSDGLADTQYCRSVVLAVLLRGHLQHMKDFWVAPWTHSSVKHILLNHLDVQEDDRIHN